MTLSVLGCTFERKLVMSQLVINLTKFAPTLAHILTLHFTRMNKNQGMILNVNHLRQLIIKY